MPARPNAAAQYERVYVSNRQEWRAWLEKNHATSPGIWLIYYKKESGKPRVSYDDSVEEALCFGWIDSVVNKLDSERYMQLFTPRKPKSTWSRSNKERVERLIAQGLMTPVGLEKIEIAKQNGTWTILDQVEDIVIPEDLERALAENPTARENFMAFSKSVKKGILGWIQIAKRPETRAKRIADTVAKAAQDIPINFERVLERRRKKS